MKYLIVLGFLSIILGLLIYVKLITLSMLWIIVFLISIINAMKSKKVISFIGYNFIVCISTTIGIIVNYFDCKTYGIGYHQELIDEYRFLVLIHIGYIFAITSVMGIIKSIQNYHHKRAKE